MPDYDEIYQELWPKEQEIISKMRNGLDCCFHNKNSECCVSRLPSYMGDSSNGDHSFAN